MINITVNPEALQIQEALNISHFRALEIWNGIYQRAGAYMVEHEELPSLIKMVPYVAAVANNIEEHTLGCLMCHQIRGSLNKVLEEMKGNKAAVELILKNIRNQINDL